MPRIARLVVPEQAHHITQRGNNRQTVFFSDRHRKMYLELLREYTARYGVNVVGYCLMTNHVHVIAIPGDRCGLAKALGRTHNDYARWLNIQRRESGHVWQNRFYSCPLAPAYLWAVLAYVERNPLRADMVSRPEEWCWSSAKSHCRSLRSPSWIDVSLWRRHWTPELWRTVLQNGLAEAEIQARMQEATRTGRPMGDAEFIAKCERELGVRLQRSKSGPKQKTSPFVKAA